MLEVRKLCKSFGGLQVTRDVSFALEPGERRVILGPNGAGKTTLFNQLVGTLRPSSGDILVQGRSVMGLSVSHRAREGLSRSYQKNNLFEDLTVRENLQLAAAAGQGKARGIWRDSFRDTEVCETVAEVAPLRASIAALALEASANSTKPKPRGRPVSRSITRVAETTSPCCEKISRSSLSDV